MSKDLVILNLALAEVLNGVSEPFLLWQALGECMHHWVIEKGYALVA